MVNEDKSMNVTKRSPFTSCLFFGTVMALCCLLAGSRRAEAQAQPPCTKGQGFNAIYGNCNGSATLQGTYAFIDASQYQGDICQAMQSILAAYNTNHANGVVVDARGFPLPQGQSTYSCSVNPWNNSLQPSNNVVLLPVGTIQVQSTWTLPTNTRLIGEGPSGTILQTASNFGSSGDLIDMGSTNVCPGSPPYCAGIGVEHLALVGPSGSNTTNGIVNCCSQELSYVKDVTLSNLGGTGILVQADAGNSGPYSNVYFSGSGICAQVLGATRGIHGLTCITSGSSSGAVYVDGPNNSIEDVYIQGSQDGVLVGSQHPAQGNLLFNIVGSGLANVVHLTTNASDVTIMGATRSGGTNTIKDDLVGKSITDANVGMYIVGDPVVGTNGSIGNSRFTTSTSSNAATWLVGPNSPSGSCAVGDLYSQTTGTGTTLFGCGLSQGSPVWYGIK